MATRIQQIELLASPEFQKQVTGSLLMAAINVLNEDAGTPNHAERVSWANQIMQQPAGQAGILLNFVLTNATVSGAAGNPPGDSGTPVSDSDMDYVIASLFDRFALQQAG